MTSTASSSIKVISSSSKSKQILSTHNVQTLPNAEDKVQMVIVDHKSGTLWLRFQHIAGTLFGAAYLYVRCEYDIKTKMYIPCEGEVEMKEVFVKESELALLEKGLSRKGHPVLENPIKEAALLKKIPPHNNITKVHESLLDSKMHYLVYQFYRGGDLLEFINIDQRMFIPELDILPHFLQIVKAVQHLHHHNIVHLDISLENILMHKLPDATYVPILTDFGIAIELPKEDDDHIVLTQRVGKYFYMAPEMFELKFKIDDYNQGNVQGGPPTIRAKPCDVWTLGSTLFLMLYRIPLCEKVPSLLHDTKFAFFFAENGYGIEGVLNYWKFPHSPQSLELLQRILVLDPNNRINVDDLAVLVQQKIDELTANELTANELKQ